MAATSSSSSSSCLLFINSSSVVPILYQHHHLHLQRFQVTKLLVPPLRASSSSGSRRYPQDAVVVVPDPRAWVTTDFTANLNHHQEADDDDDDDKEEEEEEEEDRSLDLFVRFVLTIYTKISRRARKSVRSVLPPSISTKLVKFSVNGVIILAFLWILKALLEVVCTFGSMVFLSILLVRGIWSAVAYFRENQYSYRHRIDHDDGRWSRVQTAA